MTDILERLRQGVICTIPCHFMDTAFGCECVQAADEIERLTARIAALEGMVMTGQGEQIKLAADLLQEKIVSNRLRAALAPLVALAKVIRDDAEKATEGPWEVRGKQNVGSSSTGASVAKTFWQHGKHDARLICALRNDALPAILAAADAVNGDDK